MEYKVLPAKRIVGTVRPPADKSVAHRAAIFSSVAEGVSRIHGYPRGADTLSTVRCLMELGVEIHWEDDTLVISGRGPGGLKEPSAPLDCGNSGTTMRLLAGLLAGQSFDTVLTGDESLLRRPMERIAEPLRRMGAQVELANGKAPIHIRAGSSLKGIEYVLPVPSAQVKSAVLLAGLYARGTTTVIEPIPTRDHTERMLALPRDASGGRTAIYSTAAVRAPVVDMSLPGDISSAAFFIAAAIIVEGSSVELVDVGINPTRCGIIDVLEEAGGTFEAYNHRMVGREPVCDLVVASAALSPIQVDGRMAPRLIDEIPILSVVATRANGESRFSDVGELRAKESDRIAAVSVGLSAMGANVEVSDTAFAVTGPCKLKGAVINSERDHRIAMAMAIAGLVARGETRILGAEAADVSYPGFWQDLERLALR